MKKVLSLLLLMNVFVVSAQQTTPALNNDDIRAYWYAVPTDSVVSEIMGGAKQFESQVHVYGKIPQGDFSVTIKAFNNSQVFFTKQIDIKNRKSTDPQAKYSRSNDDFRLLYPTGCGLQKPDKMEIEITTSNDRFVKTIPCTYHTISGHITDFDGNPFKGYFSVSPDDFFCGIAVWADDNGFYSIDLPERSYNTFYCDDHTYGVSTLEYWGWRMIVDRDETLNIRVGNGEVYDLHAWSNNGGYDAYFLYFRPMVLPKLQAGEEEYESQITLNGNTFDNMNIAPTLEVEDLQVKINGEVVPVISLQPVYETGKTGNEFSSMNAYIAQVERPQSAKGKKLTFELSYDKTITVGGREVRVNSMGQCQLYTNISGMSEVSF